MSDIATKLITVADNVPAVAKAVNAAKVTASGAVIRVDDVLDVEHGVGVLLRSKNLIDISMLPTNPAKSYVLYQEDGTILVDGIRANTTGLGCGKTLREIAPSLKAGKTYFLQATSTIANRQYIYLRGYNSSWFFGRSLTITDVILDSDVFFYTNAGERAVVSNMQIEEGTTATEYTPYVADFSGKAVKVYGKNLLSDDVKDWSNYDSSGNYLLSLPAGVYAVWGDFDNDDSTVYVYLKKSNDGGATWVVSDPSIHTILPSGATNSSGYIVTGNNAGVIVSFTVTDDPNEKWCIWTRQNDIGKINFLQLEVGTAATDYEPHKAPQTATADASGKVKGLRSVSPTMTLMADSNSVTVECTYFPQSAADTYAKYQQIKNEQTALRDNLHGYLQEE